VETPAVFLSKFFSFVDARDAWHLQKYFEKSRVD
jgi:hypothetical protein